MWWIKELASPLVYLKINIGDGSMFHSKRVYDFYLPIVLAIATTTLLAYLPDRPNLLGEGGIVRSISGFLTLLIAFFIAALAAVATFDRPSLDTPLRGSHATLKRWDNSLQTMRQITLTRRQFVCHLFGYLAFVSLLLYLLIIAVEIVGPTWSKLAPPTLQNYASVALVFAFWAVFWNLILCTLLGLHFLSDRMQHED